MSKLNLKETFANLREEYKKIYWPSKGETYHVTVIVLLITAFIAVYSVLFDTAFNFVLTKISEILRSFLGGA